jgi:hypothetical protein
MAKQTFRTLIVPGDSVHGISSEDFAKLIPAEQFEKLEKLLGVESPSGGFRRSLSKSLWGFYCNAAPCAESKISRAALLRKLRKAAARAGELESLAGELLASENPIVLRELEDLVPPGLDPYLAGLSHQSGSAFVGTLHAFALKAQLLAQTLPPDPGGPREAMPFDRLVICLGRHYRLLTGEEPLVTTQGRFFRFISAVTDTLRGMESRLPAAHFKLPPNNNALRVRLHRLAKPICT